MPDEGEDEGINEDHRYHTKWVILVNPDKGTWIISRVSEGAQVGECEIDMSRIGNEWFVAALFDSNVEALIKALMEIGGNSLEGNSRIEDLLMGTCRSFVEAQANLEKWRVTRPI